MVHSEARMARKPSKADLPTKECVVCGLPFTWRKKWARDWENVKYCSLRCRAAPAGSVAKRRSRKGE